MSSISVYSTSSAVLEGASLSQRCPTLTRGAWSLLKVIPLCCMVDPVDDTRKTLPELATEPLRWLTGPGLVQYEEVKRKCQASFRRGAKCRDPLIS
jgi:hypothetical protein